MKLTITFLLIFAHSFIFSQLPSYVPKNGLVGYWPFDGNANDYSGNNNNGVVKGATLITGRTGIASTAYNFNGNDNTIEVSHNTILNLDTAFSINLWVKLPASQVNNPASYVSKYSLSQKSGFVFPYINEGVSGFGLNLTTENGTTENAAGQGQYLTSQIANKTSWHQFTAVFSNGNYKLYVDGFIVKTNSGLGNTLVNNTNNLIFGNSTGYNQFAKGGLDEVGIWNRSLTENEIIALNGCVAPITTIAANASTNICPGSSVALSANSGSNFTYQWYRNDTIIQGATSISYTASNMGSYAVIVKSGPCPTKSSPIQVSFQLPNNLPYNPFSDTVKSCINDVVLDAGAGFTKYEWGDNSINQKLTVKEPGFHKVKITYGNNCVAFDSTYVDLIVQAKIRANDTTICYRNELLLTNEPSINNVRYLKYNVYSSDYNYFGVNELEVFVNGVNIAKNKKIYSNAGWGPELANDGNQTTGWGSSSYHFFQVSPTTPHILMIDLGVLSNLDSVKLRTSSTGAYWSKQNISLMTSIDSLNWKLVARTTLTDGEVFKPTFYNGYTYKWYKNDNLISSETNRIFHVKNPGVYKLEISKNNCTSISKSINVKYDNPPTEDGEYDVFQDSLISCGKDLVLDAGVGYKSYFWSDSLKTQTKTVTKSGSYSAIVQYGINGCKAKDSVYVEVIKSELNHKDTTICFENSVLLKQSNKRSSIRYIKFESYASADASQVNVYEIEVYSKGINVALGKNTTVNSGGGGSSIVDGNGYSRWSSSRGDFGGPSKDHPHFIIVDLGSEYDFSQPTDRIVVNIDGFDHWKQSFSVLASSDNNTWFKIGGEDDKTGIFTYILGDINLLGYNYQWYKNNTPISSAIQYNYTASESGNYTLKVTKGSCEVTSAPVKITVESPTVNNTAYNPFQDSIVSCGKDLVLDAGIGFKSYLWNDSLKTQTKTITKSGSYSATVEYGTIGCKAKDSVFVDVVKSVLNQKDTTICFGNSVRLTNKETQPGIRFVKMEVTSSTSDRLLQHIEVISNGANVALDKAITANKGWGIEEIVRQWAGNGWWTPGTSSTVTDPSYFTLDLGKVYETTIKINSLSFQLNSTLNYNVYTSADNINWIKIISENQASGTKTYNLDGLNLYETIRNYQWYKNTTPISSATQYTYIVSESGSYRLKVTKGSCEVTSAPVNITVESPTVNNTAYNPFQDSIVSCGKDLVLDAGVGYKSYFWSDSLKTQTKTITKSGSYSATVEYGTIGCKAKDSVFVDVVKSGLNQKDTTICFGNSVSMKQSNKRSSLRYIKFESYASADANQVNVYEIEAYSKGMNVALGKNTIVNSGGGGFSVVDGNGYSRWSSNRGDFGGPSKDHPHFIIVDLGSEYDFNQPTDRIVVNIDGFDHWKQTFSVLVSSDNNTWLKIGNEDDKTGMFTYTLGEVSLPGYNYQWYNDNNLISNANQYFYEAKESGTYTLKVKKGNCEVTSIPVKITVDSPSKLPFNPIQDTLVACNQDVVLDAGVGFSSYAWSDGKTISMDTIKKSGNYSITVSFGKNGCTLSDQGFIQVIKPTLNLSDSILVCNTNDSKFLSAIDTTYSIGYSYQWYKDGNKLLSETKKYITTNTLGSYQLELSKDKCILKSKPLIIYVITTPPNPLSDSLIGCGNPIVLDVSKYSNIIWSIPGDKGNYSNYNPKITTDYSGLYSVQFTYRSCPFSDRVVVSNLIPNVQLERQVGSTSLLNILCGDEQIKIVNTISNSNFLNPQGTRYDWYKNSSLLPNHFDNILVSDSGIYTLKLKYKSCTTTSDTIRLSKKVLPSNALYFSNTLNLCEGANVTVKALADGTYKWSTGSTNQSILLTSAQKGTYFVNITDKNGCVAKSDTFSIVDKTVPSVNICMVTTLNNKNLLIWNNDLSDIATLAKYRIYKQNSTNSTYDMIHEQSITDLSEYVDSTSQPSQQIARYKLSIIDSCGNEKISSNHTTMLLTSNLGVNGTVNLLWNPYEGFVYDNFEIWRSENGVDYVKLDQVSNNTFSYIDNNPPASCFYQLRIENKMGCNSSKRGSYSSVRSNIIDKNGKSLSVSDNIELTELVKLFPNPSSGLFTLTNIPLDAHLTFMDVTGKEIMKLNTFDRKIDVDLSKLVDNGVYFLKVQSIYQEDQIINFNIIK